MAVAMARQGKDEDRIDALERAFVTLHSELTAEMDRRFDKVDARLDKMEERFDRRFEQIDRRFEQIERRFEQIERRFEQIDGRFEGVDEKFDRMYRLMVTVCGSVIVTLIATCGGLVATQL
ncbi:MAG TPA: hypothetical protein VHI77_09715 [Solirubrobacterales bacterium]|jgi:predicted RNase H-like nuclease (RuvC/YqgF family)|nr:hypothetical protein [Solirubrobacterales bacterium]